MSGTRPLSDQNTFLALIGHVCLQWALLEHVMLFLIASAENIRAEKAYAYFGGMDMLPRVGLAIRLAHDAKWPLHLIERIRAIRKALQDGEHLAERRNQAVHGVHRQSEIPGHVNLTMVRGRGPKMYQDVSIEQMAELSGRLAALAQEADAIFKAYGAWKFGPDGEQDSDDEIAPAVPHPILKLASGLKGSLKRLFGYK